MASRYLAIAKSQNNWQSLILIQEGASGKIDLKEDDPDTVARMLRFCYTYDYGIIPDNQTAAPDTEDVPMMAHARIYFIADKYGIGLLKDLAKKNFQEVGKEKWRSESFPTVIEAIYENTLPSDGLRACLVSIIKQHKKDLSESVPFMDVVRSGGDFAADVFDGWTNDGVPTAKALGHKNLTAKILQDTFYCRTAGTQRWFTLWERDNGLCSVCGHRLFMDKQGKVLEHPT